MQRLSTVMAVLSMGLLSTLAGPGARAQDISRQIPADDTFWENEISWQGLPGGYPFRAKLIVVDGIIEWCGIGAFTNLTSRPAAMKMLRGAALKMNGQTILQDFSFFARVNRESDVAGGLANCRSTRAAAPRTEPEIEVDWPDGSFRN